ncbi:MAG: IMP dehydrogenase [archaeon]
MVKKIITEPGRTFHEFSLLTNYSSKDCIIKNISLRAILHLNLKLKIPLLSAAMSSVTGFDMALALGKEGGLGVLPVRLPLEDQVGIIKKIKSYEMSFVEDPVTKREDVTVEEVLKEIERVGHSTIPIVDKNNVFLGMFTEQHYFEKNVSKADNVKSAMIGFGSDEILCCNDPKIYVSEAKKMLRDKNKNYLVVLDAQNRLVKLAFRKDIEEIKIGAAISTHEGWQKRVRAIVDAGVDLIVVDTSDAYSEFVKDLIIEYKKGMKIKVPLCVGNVITYDGALFLMRCGADIVKVGMSPGSICSTQREKAVGRAPMSALISADKARSQYFKEKRRYVPIIIDGGIVNAADMIVTLTIADGMMMGYYFNRFYEAAADKLDENKTLTRDENRMRYVETWGEGSLRAQNLDRYGHFSKTTFFPEGEEGTIPYAGRLKPNLNKDIKKIKSALSNAGSMNLDEFRKNSVLELLSIESSRIVSDVHDISVKK